jgi:hypothetical protein
MFTGLFLILLTVTSITDGLLENHGSFDFSGFLHHQKGLIPPMSRVGATPSLPCSLRGEQPEFHRETCDENVTNMQKYKCKIQNTCFHLVVLYITDEGDSASVTVILQYIATMLVVIVTYCTD